MNAFTKSISSAMTRLYIRSEQLTDTLKHKLHSEKGQFVVDNGVVLLIIVVVGAIVLGLFKTFVNDDLAPSIRQKMLDFFN